MNPSTFIARHVRETIKDNRDLHGLYLNNAQFHYVVDRACQAPTEKQAVRFLLDGLALLAKDVDRCREEATIAAMTRPADLGWAPSDDDRVPR